MNEQENEFNIPEVPPEVILNRGVDAATGPKRDQWDRPYRLLRVEQENEKENFLPVGHNGTVFQIKRGEEVEVPQCVIDVLKDAVGSKLIKVPDGVGGTVYALQDYNSVPFSVIR